MGIVRLLLAVAVLAHHTGSILGFKFVSADLAVEGFYMISGFYMALILTEKYIGRDGSYKLFITNRLLRLYPTYWFILFFYILLWIGAPILFHKNFFFAEITPYLSCLSAFDYFIAAIPNFFLIGMDWMFLFKINVANCSIQFTPHYSSEVFPLKDLIFVGQAWTIGLEITFYLIAPFLVRSKKIFLFAIIIASLIFRFAIYNLGYNDRPWNYQFFPFEILFFVLGILCYSIYIKLKVKKIDGKILKTIFYIILAYLVLFQFINIDFSSIIYFIVLFITIPFLFLFTKNSKLDRAIGELSYPVYLSHILTSYFLSQVLSIDNFFFGFINCILCIGFSIIINKFIVEKIEKYRQARLA